MPVEIKELEIKTQLVEDHSHSMSKDEKEELIEECIDRVLEILKEKNEM